MNLENIKTLEDKILSFKAFVDSKAEDITKFDIDSQESSDMFNILEEANFKISLLLTVLVIEKAKAGIYGKNWYKQGD